MAMAHMYEVNEKVDFLQKMISAAARNCGVPVPDDSEELWQLKLPPNLTAEQAFSWYRMLNLVKRRRRLADKAVDIDKLLPCFNLEIPEEKQEEIQRILNNVSMDTPPNVTQIRSGKNYEVQNVFEKYKHIENSEFKKKFIQSVTGTLEQKIQQNKHYNLSYKRDPRLDFDYEQEWNKKIRNQRYLEMLDYRRKLPAYYKVEELIRMVTEQQVILVSGETGCGKTTQIPQFILDYELKSGRGSVCHIICTQPRRISAIAISERVAQERAEKLGESVGFQIRLERVRPRKTGSILYCTTGTLLQMMQADPVLRDVSHVILDEVHERNTMSDFILAILKDIIQLRRDLKVILMSASLNAERFSEYFKNCPIINIPGRSFPVTEYYLEDVLQMTGFRYKKINKGFPIYKSSKEEAERNKYREEFLIPYTRNPQSMRNYSPEVLECLLSPHAEILNMDLIYELICFICDNEPPGAILVFLPGWDRILKLLNKIESSGKFPKNKFVVVPLHSMLSTIGQKNVFSTPPEGMRKIVIATNIAETSITIDDIVYVIDSGMEKLSDFDTADNICTLEERWISQSNAKQRKGRAGRVQAGYCYKLYSRPKELNLAPFQLPEMLRTRLEEVVLQTKVLQLGHTETFLSKVLDPPSSEAVKISLELLQGMNALDEEENLTPLGFHLAHLPIDPMAGKMMLLGTLFGCLDPISSIACSLSVKDCFSSPPGQIEAMDNIKLAMSDNTKSDHILLAKVFDEWRDAKSRNKAKDFTMKHFLNNSTLHMVRDLKKQMIRHLGNMGFLKTNNVQGGMANYNSSNIPLLRSIVCAGLYPNIAVVSKVKPRDVKNRYTVIMATLEDQHVQLHHRSINSMVGEFESVFFAYFSKMRSSHMYLHDTTMVYPMALIFFCHSFHIEEIANKKVIAINKRLRFACKPSTANLLQELRAWLDWLMDYKVAHPCSIDWTMNNDENFILKAIIELLSLEIKVNDSEMPEEALAQQSSNQLTYMNYGQYGNMFAPTSQLLSLEQSSSKGNREEELPWIKEKGLEIKEDGLEKGVCDMSGSDMSTMSGEESLLEPSVEPRKKKIKRNKTQENTSFMKKERGPDPADERPWIRSLVSPQREKDLQVAVIIRDLQPMTLEEANVVKRSLITDVGLALRGVGPGCNGTVIQPRFTESTLVPAGILLFSCLDEVTRDWLLAWTPPKLQFSPNRFLQVVKGDSLIWPEKLQVAVVLKEFLPMTSKDADDVRLGLVADVSSLLRGGQSIHFSNLEFVDPGWLLITCMDRASRDWVLKWHPPRVRMQQTYMVSADTLPWPIRIGLTLQSDQKPDWDSVFYYIRHQNSSLDIDSWKFIDSTQNPDGSWIISLSVSPDSITALDKVGWKLFYQVDYILVVQFGRMPLISSLAMSVVPTYPVPYQQNQPFQQQPNIFNYLVHH